MILEQQHFEWLIAVGQYGHAHVFCLGDRLSLCVKRERHVPGGPVWVPDTVDEGAGQPKRVRCVPCTYLLTRLDMVEVDPKLEVAE